MVANVAAYVGADASLGEVVSAELLMLQANGEEIRTEPWEQSEPVSL